MKAADNRPSSAGTSSRSISKLNLDNRKDGNKVKDSLPQRLNPKIKFKPITDSFRSAPVAASAAVDTPRTPISSPKRGCSPATIVAGGYIVAHAKVFNASPTDKPGVEQRILSGRGALPPGFRRVRLCQLRLRKMPEIEVIYEGPNAAAMNEDRAAISREREVAKAAFAAEKAKLHASRAAAANSATAKNSGKISAKTSCHNAQTSLDSWLKKPAAKAFLVPLPPAAALPTANVVQPSFFIVTSRLDRTQKFRNYVSVLQSHFTAGSIVVRAGIKRLRFLKKNAHKYEDSRLFSAVLPRGAVLSAVSKVVEHKENDLKPSYPTSLDAGNLFTLISVVQFVWGLRLACKCSHAKSFNDVKALCNQLPTFDSLYGFLCGISPAADSTKSPVPLKPSIVSVKLAALLRLLLFLLIADEEEPDKIFNHSTQSLLVSDELLSFRFLRRLVKREQGHEADTAAERYEREVKDKNEGEAFTDRSAGDIDLSKWLGLESYMEQLDTDPNVTLWPPERILGLLHALIMLVAQSGKLNSILEKVVEVTTRKRADIYQLGKELAPLKKQLAAGSSISATLSKKAKVAVASGSSSETTEKVSIEKVASKQKVAAASKSSSPRHSVELSSSSEKPAVTEAVVDASTSVADERAAAALNRKITELGEKQQRLQRELDETELIIDCFKGAVRFLGFDRNQSAYFALMDGGGTVFANLNNFAAQQFFATSLPAPAAGSDIGSFMAFHASLYGATRVHLNVVDEAHPDDLREIICRAKSKANFTVTVGKCAVDRLKLLPRTATILEMSNLCRNTLSSCIIKYSGLDEINALLSSLNPMGVRESQLKRLLQEYIVEQWGEEVVAAEAAEQFTDHVDADENTLNDADELKPADKEEQCGKAADSAEVGKKRIRRKIDGRCSVFEAPDFSRPDNTLVAENEPNVGHLDDIWVRVASFANNMYEQARSQFAFFNDISTSTSSSHSSLAASSAKSSNTRVKKLRFAQAAVWLVEPDVSAAQLVDASETATSVGYSLIEALLEYADALRTDYVTEFGRHCIRYIKTHREDILGKGEQSAWFHLYLVFKLFGSEGIDIPDNLAMRTRKKRTQNDEASISGGSDAGSRASRQKLTESFDQLFDNFLTEPDLAAATVAAGDVANGISSQEESNGEEEDYEAEPIMRQASEDDEKNDADYRLDDSDGEFYGSRPRRKRSRKDDSSEQSSRRSSRGSSGRRVVVDPAVVAAANVERQRAEREARLNKRATADAPQGRAPNGASKKRARVTDEGSPSTASSVSGFSLESGRSGGSRRLLRGFAVKPGLASVDEEDDVEVIATDDDAEIPTAIARRRLRASNRAAASPRRDPGSSSSSVKSDDGGGAAASSNRANDSGSSAGNRNNTIGDDDERNDDKSVEELYRQPAKASSKSSSSNLRRRVFARDSTSVDRSSR